MKIKVIKQTVLSYADQERSPNKYTRIYCASKDFAEEQYINFGVCSKCKKDVSKHNALRLK